MEKQDVILYGGRFDGKRMEVLPAESIVDLAYFEKDGTEVKNRYARDIARPGTFAFIGNIEVKS